MPGWLRSRWQLMLAALVIAVPVLVVWLHDRSADPPLTAAQSHPAAEVHVMPNRAVPRFLRAQGVKPQNLRIGGGTAVVAHLTWAPLRPAADNRYDVLLAGNGCQAGLIDSVIGAPVRDASLGFSSSWNDRLERTPWLRGDVEREQEGGDITDAQIASVPASYGAIWVVGRIVDVCGVTEEGQAPRAVADPAPVVGVALTTGDRIWWVDRVSG